MSVKFKVYFDKMIQENKKDFVEFERLSFLYQNDNDKYQEEFNNIGKIIQSIVRDYDNRLCANTERGMYNKFSSGLSEKFIDLVRNKYPLYDHIGIISQKFQIRKIRLM